MYFLLLYSQFLLYQNRTFLPGLSLNTVLGRELTNSLSSVPGYHLYIRGGLGHHCLRVPRLLGCTSELRAHGSQDRPPSCPSSSQ